MFIESAIATTLTIDAVISEILRVRSSSRSVRIEIRQMK